MYVFIPATVSKRPRASPSWIEPLRQHSPDGLARYSSWEVMFIARTPVDLNSDSDTVRLRIEAPIVTLVDKGRLSVH